MPILGTAVVCYKGTEKNAEFVLHNYYDEVAPKQPNTYQNSQLLSGLDYIQDSSM